MLEILSNQIQNYDARRIIEICIGIGLNRKEFSLREKILQNNDHILKEYWFTEIFSLSDKFDLDKLMFAYPQFRKVQSKASDLVKSVPDFYFDLIFFNTTSIYTELNKHIKEWILKVKPGGYMIGSGYYLYPIRVSVQDCFGENEIHIINTNSGMGWKKQV